jgi:hypothetical protein
MLLAVAGLKAEEIKAKTKQLATGDWSSFPPVEAQAFEFAHRLAKSPSSISDKHIQELTATFGPHRPLDVIWYSSWCNYMTRVADAFQLPLERDNVFARPEPKKVEPKDTEEKKPG